MDDIDSNALRTGKFGAIAGQAYALCCFVAALIAAPFVDLLTSALLILTTFLLAVVCRYSARYMAGDPGQARFTFWLCLTGTWVIAIILSQNLLLFALAWCGASLSLHQLLQFYGHRPGAILAARKKFLISRLGDACLIAALIVTWRQFGTWDFQKMFALEAQMRGASMGGVPSPIHWIAGLLAFAAMLKSAQFPFHTWLPDTMETPTPVSALMHAGIINAGGILILRLNPLISASPIAMGALCVVGAVTALFASVVMLTQASVKRCLAFSTVAQMGFMMLECGLGAFHLALLHLIAHSLYKAHAFLASGSAVQEGLRQRTKPVSFTLVISALAAATLAVLGAARLMGAPVLNQPLLTGVFALALTQALWPAFRSVEWTWRLPASLALGAAFSFAYLLLERGTATFIAPLPGAPLWVALPALTPFLLVMLMQAQLPHFARSAFGQRFYVHARNGFYLNTLANRIATAIWPVRMSQEEI